LTALALLFLARIRSPGPKIAPEAQFHNGPLSGFCISASSALCPENTLW
jgi:hypothetical protein